MLNYAPDSMARISAVFTQAWAIAKPTESLPDTLLRGPIETRRQAPAVFQPERISGYCAGC
jgi:hypothetical protein